MAANIDLAANSMSDWRTGLQRFYTELRRRRFLRVVIVYVIVGLAVLEGTSNLADALNFSDRSVTLVALLFLLGLPFAVFFAWFFDIMPAASEAAVRSPSPTALPSPDLPRSSKSIAVLPFDDMSAEQDQQYLGDGIAEEIINALTRVEDLSVVARTSSFALRGRDQQAHEIGANLNVGTLLEGSVRKAGNQVRITAQLVDVANGYHLWSERYDRELEDVFAIQDEIAHAIVDTLKVKLVGDEKAPTVRRGTSDLDAYTLYLKGRYHWNKRTSKELEKGIALFEQAIAIDDRYALAWAGLADSFSILGWYRYLSAQEAYEETESAAVKAVAIDDSLGEAYTSLAYAKFLYGWDWAGAESDFQRAIDRNPNYPLARHWYAEFLLAMGRFDEAIEQVKIARALDPLSLTIGIGVGWVLYFLGRYDEAIEQYEKTIARDPNLILAPRFLGPAYVKAGKYDRAIAMYDDWISRESEEAGLIALRAHAYARSGQREDALKAAANLEERAKRERVPPDYLALVHTGLADYDRAFEWLEKALELRVWYLVYLKVDPLFAPLRSDPRYGALLTRIGLDRTPIGVASS